MSGQSAREHERKRERNREKARQWEGVLASIPLSGECWGGGISQ